MNTEHARPVLEGKGLSMRFGGLIALDEVDLRLDRGEILGVIGPNGAGKSTLLNLITGLYRASAGEVLLEGRSLRGTPPHRIVAAGIARTFQSSRLFGSLSVIDNVLIGMHTATSCGVLDALLRPGRAGAEMRDAVERASALLRHVSPDLLARRNEQAGTLPQADRRRLEIARALAADPRILLLDEPSSGMDDRDTDALIDDIRRIGSEQPELAVIIIEHDMRLIAALPDRVMVLDHGRKIGDAPFAEVRLLPRVQQAYLGRKASRSAHA